MRPRNDVFAPKYIGETMDAFATVFPADSGNAERKGELEWFVSVLTEYFDAIEPSKATDKHKATFVGALSASCFACGEQRGHELVPQVRVLAGQRIFQVVKG